MPRILLDTYGLPGGCEAAMKELDPELVVVRCKREEEGYRRNVEAAEIIVGWPAVEDLRGPALRWVALPSAGADRYAGQTPAGVTLTCARGVFGVPIAEHVLAMMLALAIRLQHAVRSQLAGKWERPQGRRELAGSCCLVIGMGDIGTEVARRTSSLGMKTLGIRRRAGERPGFVAELGTMKDLDRLLPQADHVVLALPGTSHTKHVIDGRRIAMMRHGTCIYNVGRGNAIDERAMIEALQAGHIAGAGLDVFEKEPLPAESPLWQMANVIITPHCSGGTPEHAQRFGELMVENFRRFLAGEAMGNVVDREWEY